MTQTKLDRIDTLILAELRRNGRISHQQLSELVGLSPSQCLRRVKNLETEGIITGYTTLIDEEKLGNDISAWVIISLCRNKPGARDRVAQFLRNQSWVRLATGITGDADIMIRIVAPKIADLTNILVDEINRHPDISSAQSFICLDNLFAR